MSDDEVATAIDAFQFVQMLRLHAQDDLDRGERGAEPNRIDPGALNSLDRRILREALRQERKLQNRIAMDYGL
jgi:CBS domain-containing protein